MTFPLAPENASASSDRPGRTGTYRRPDRQHAPTCLPTQVCQWPAPGASRHRFRARLAFAARSVVLPREPRMRTNGCLRHAPQHFSGLAFAWPAPFARKIPDRVRCRYVPRRCSCVGATDRCHRVSCTSSTTGEDRACSLVCWESRLHQHLKGDIVLLEQSVQGHGLFPGPHVGGHVGRRILGQAFRSFHGSRCRDVCHSGWLDPKVFVAQRSPVQNVLCVHLPILAACYMCIKDRLESPGRKHVLLVWGRGCGVRCQRDQPHPPP